MGTQAAAVDTGAIDTEPAMTSRLLSLTHASVQQLRDSIRRVTTLLSPADEAALMEEFLGGVEVTESHWGAWEDTAVDFKWLTPAAPAQDGEQPPVA